ncbi:2452_t:CDS:2, partial [Gigaspora margarita]
MGYKTRPKIQDLTLSESLRKDDLDERKVCPVPSFRFRKTRQRPTKAAEPTKQTTKLNDYLSGLRKAKQASIKVNKEKQDSEEKTSQTKRYQVDKDIQTMDPQLKKQDHYPRESNKTILTEQK